MKLLQDPFENCFCGFAKEEDCILAIRNPFSLSERKIMEVSSNILIELLDFKANVILQIKFDALSSPWYLRHDQFLTILTL